ncbi:glycosyltransferase family 4 protein [Salinivibrio costicola]|uniref:glycosyltransferase family 4 protein n=1 Tax=Salinivibrio costicola TaxID=51367 RepID=UPI0003959A17|nr:glycosyltransferase [Salinivibrio costicola]
MKSKTILIIAHHVVVKEYQELWVAAAKNNPEWSFKLIAPNYYKERGVLKSEALDKELFSLFSLPTVLGAQGRQHLFFYLGLQKTVSEIKPDLIYCAEEPNSFVSYQVSRISKTLSIPAIFWTSLNENRDYKSMYSFWNVRKYLFPWVQERVFKNSMAINATSKVAEEVLRWKGYKGSILRFPTHGVGNSFFQIANNRFSQPQHKGSLNILYLGYLYAYKGVDVLIDAVDKAKMTDAVLTIVGDGPELESLKDRAKNVQAPVNFKKSIPSHDVPLLLSSVDVLVLPSVELDGVIEKFGRVVIEAKAAGTMVIGSDIGGIPLAIGNKGWLFPQKDSDKLAELLNELCNDRALLRKLQKKCCDEVREQYSYEKLSSNLMSGIMREL